MPWVQVVFLGNLNLFRLSSVTHLFGYLPITMVAAGALLAVAGYFGVGIRLLGWMALVVVVATLTAGGRDFYELYRSVRHLRGLASFGVGAYAAAAGLVCLGILVVRTVQARRADPATGSVTRRRPTPASEAPADRSPGWKPDPWGVGGCRRYWDGASWTSDTSARPS
ncbi:DUF2510 domain-containing protein [Acidiferrimicrobium sp. IK]|uniref:DUF2510 domain-containing protein n=1 Tax=Acidiferrimicrobium sp. IK TaxID=2871700 RepID=UPI0021CB4636|nr:DUF2510 domain-containing protein [Acidiferrimicrobium sp. IK]MCU4183937.1 DUF2510 domain-containing protein [Acidiferrimicrobium sp. IK]